MHSNIRNRLFSLLLTFAMLCSLLPATALATEDGGDAPASRTGQTISVDAAWDQETTLSENLIVENGATLTINAKVTISGDVTISGGGTIMRGNYTDRLIEVPANCKLVLENITIDGGAIWEAGAEDDENNSYNDVMQRHTTNTGKASSKALLYIQGDAVLGQGSIVQNNDSSDYTIHLGQGNLSILAGSKIQNNGGSRGAIVAQTGTIKMSGGEVCSNYAGIYGAAITTWNDTAIVEMTGGKIAHNYSASGATPGAGGVYTNGPFSMSKDAEISENGCSFYTGGVLVDGNGVFTMDGGTISKNTTTKDGGGVTVRGTGKFIMNDGEISENAARQGGGVSVGSAVEYGGIFIMNGGKISKNTYMNDQCEGGGIYINGKAAIQGGEISDNLCLETDWDVKSANNSLLVVGGNITKSESWDISQQTICLNAGGGIFASDSSFTDNTLDIPTSEGSIFGGWYDNETFTGNAMTTAPTAGQTYYAKWIELKTDKVSLEYGSSQAVPTIEGVTLSSWQSSDSSIVSIEGDQLKANKVGSTTITADATTTAGDTDTLTVNVEVTPMRITYGSPDKTNNEDGRPYIVYALKADGTTPTFSELLGFYPVKVGAEPGTFEADTDEDRITLTPSMADTGDVEYCYENDASGNKLWTDTLPTHPTVNSEGNPHSIQVDLKLKNPNYRFCTVGTNWEPSDTITLYVTCYEDGMNEVDLYLAGDNTPLETFDDRHEYEYTGEGIVPTERDLTSLYTKGTNTENSITAFTAHFHAVEEGAAFAGSHLTRVANTDLTAKALKEIAPNEPGVYSFVINGYNEATRTYCYASRRYRIVKGTPKGEPTFEKASSGVALSTVTLSGSMKNAADAAVAGSFAWDNGGQTVERGKSYTWTFIPTDSNYNTVTGTAVVWPAPTSSSSSNTTTKTVTNADGSVTTTVTNKRTGTVTETTKYKDGSTLVVETKKDGTVTTTETRADGVRVKTVDAPEKDVTVSVTIPESVGTTTILGRTEAGYGMVAVDAETGKVVKLSVPTEDGLLVKLDGSAELTLVNNAREFSDTNGHWAENAIDFATAHEMFAGTSETTFSPDDTMTRAMLMTVLARFDGEDTAGGSVWYEKGMAWAVANGVSDGSYPEDSISREQLVTMLWRYAGSPTVSGMALSEFSDHDSVSGYAADAMRWAVSEGLIVGVEHDVLAPRSTATRAQVATILMRFVEMLTK